MDDREEGVGGGHLGLALAPALGQAAVAGAGPGLGLAGADGGPAEQPGQVAVAPEYSARPLELRPLVLGGHSAQAGDGA